MTNKYQNIALYLLIVCLPTLIGGLYSFYQSAEEDYNQREEDTYWIASVHQKSWDQFISETFTMLEILSLSIRTDQSADRLQYLLQEAHRMDPRYGGIYLLDPSGTIMAGSNSYLENADLSDTEYIKEIRKTKDIIISNKEEKLINGQNVIGVGKPVFSESGEMSAILIAHLRSDYMENIMKVLTPNTSLTLLNAEDELIFNIVSAKEDSHHTISVPLESLPWTLEVNMSPKNSDTIYKQVMAALAKYLIITHIIFFFIKYFMLKRQAQQEKKENELQKLELVGTLAASTAHEIRNPLTGIKGLVQLLSEKYTSSTDQYYFSVINDEINRINEIVSEFLILGKPTAQKNETMDLNQILSTLDPLIRSEALMNRINYQCELPNDPTYVKGTKDQMKQVILNITKNAFESMEAGGSLTIKLSVKNSKCQIKIIDTGTGISEQAIKKIFQPFYTSKDMGTGLGLVVCRRIIQSFGGEIFITSKENFGTQVDIFLPSQEDQEE
ncbi:ATP-binding protein [Cytobacillus gottheilii]|uniref:ATP-binding protein n=1 Tax=Cytobacillus gottheilii TaxID=859144 RepID=UPI0009BB23E6|nr:ATP-binding protein [Cytobacillus gottheilii]